MKTVILAGGRGTRIAEEGSKLPKPMVTIGGQPILWHILKYYSHFGHNEFIICCGYLGSIIKEYFANYYLHRSDITFDFTDNNKVEIHSNFAERWKVTLVDTGLDSQTGGRIKRIQRYVKNEPFFLTYGDGVSNIDLNKLLKFHQDSNVSVTISAVQPGGRYGMLDFNENDKLIGFREKAKDDGGWINAGFMIAESDIFNYLDGDDCILERLPFEKLSSEGKMAAYKHFDYWQCMDTQRDRIFLEERWREGNALWKVWD
ncbi:glucose-1-phosphate cytidylyltransferase [Desulfosporosinus sp. FKA]|uniref:glucose-1-phosphate cytidylyltransferase n=1 Tax=Desulfosporosinus sp. FKA TaxID=1969834 RepID=UPI000B49D1AD|nr:glucose-1-phosphate cytidylyltransferase [Desulfosporosinus sp. FKA]